MLVAAWPSLARAHVVGRHRPSEDVAHEAKCLLPRVGVALRVEAEAVTARSRTVMQHVVGRVVVRGRADEAGAAAFVLVLVCRVEAHSMCASPRLNRSAAGLRDVDEHQRAVFRHRHGVARHWSKGSDGCASRADGTVECARARVQLVLVPPTTCESERCSAGAGVSLREPKGGIGRCRRIRSRRARWRAVLSSRT